MAAGLAPKRLGIPGEKELWNRRVFAYADPLDVPHEGKDVVVIGGGDAAFDQALHFAARARNVAIAMRGTAPRCLRLLEDRAREKNIAILSSHRPESIEERGRRLAISFAADGTRVERDADFLIACIGKEARLDFLSPEILNGEVPGIFFAGDCRLGRGRHIAIAAGDGIAAAIAAADFIVERTRG